MIGSISLLSLVRAFSKLYDADFFHVFTVSGIVQK